jgi:hypothetical protein
MAVRRTSTVAAEARAAARRRRTGLLEKQRERETRIGELAEEHAVALAVADEVQVRVDAEKARLQERADAEIAAHRAAADTRVAELLDLDEPVQAVAELLGLSTAEVRAARRRVRGTGGTSAAPAREVEAAAEESPGSDAAVAAVAGAEVTSVGGTEDVSAAA